MKLTGKCLSDFGDQCTLQYKNFIKLPETCQNALIIEFFDSVGIFIYTIPSLRTKNKWTYRVFKSLFQDFTNQVSYIYKSRTEATNKAIEKANEIYNNQKLK